MKKQVTLKKPEGIQEWILWVASILTALTILVGAGQKYYESAYDLITGSNSAMRMYEQRQLELWRINKQCLRNDPQKFETPQRELITLLLCPDTASLLVEVVPPQITKSTSTWIELNKVRRQDGEARNTSEKDVLIFYKSLISGLEASEREVRKVNQGTSVVELCRWTDKVSFNVIRKYEGNVCFIEKIYLDDGMKKFINIKCELVKCDYGNNN